jgi:protease I
MPGKLSGRTIAVLATEGGEQVEPAEPLKALHREGAEVHVISDKANQIQGFGHHDKADKIPVDKTLDEVSPDRYDALVPPGGVINPDALRLVPQAISFIHHFVTEGLSIAAICHGPWTLIDAGGVKGGKIRPGRLRGPI